MLGKTGVRGMRKGGSVGSKLQLHRRRKVDCGGCLWSRIITVYFKGLKEQIFHVFIIKKKWQMFEMFNLIYTLHKIYIYQYIT